MVVNKVQMVPWSQPAEPPKVQSDRFPQGTGVDHRSEHWGGLGASVLAPSSTWTLTVPSLVFELGPRLGSGASVMRPGDGGLAATATCVLSLPGPCIASGGDHKATSPGGGLRVRLPRCTLYLWLRVSPQTVLLPCSTVREVESPVGVGRAGFQPGWPRHVMHSSGTSAGLQALRALANLPEPKRSLTESGGQGLSFAVARRTVGVQTGKHKGRVAATVAILSVIRIDGHSVFAFWPFAEACHPTHRAVEAPSLTTHSACYPVGTQ